MPIVSNDKCKNMFLSAGRHEYIPDIFMCAGYDEGGRDSCQVGSITRITSIRSIAHLPCDYFYFYSNIRLLLAPRATRVSEAS